MKVIIPFRFLKISAHKQEPSINVEKINQNSYLSSEYKNGVTISRQVKSFWFRVSKFGTHAILKMFKIIDIEFNAGHSLLNIEKINLFEKERKFRKQLLQHNLRLKKSLLKKILDRALFNKNNLSVGWILCGSENVGSSRIHGINLHKGLLELKINSYLAQKPYGYIEYLSLSIFDKFLIRHSRMDIVIFQRVHDQQAIHFNKALQNKGTITGFFMADIYNSDILHSVDFVLSPSTILKKTLLNEGVSSEKIFILPDAVETNPSLKKSFNFNISGQNKKIKLVWVGAEGHWYTLEPIYRILKTNKQLKNFELLTISNHQDANIRWSLDTVWDHILECDIAIVPVDLSKPESLVKSNNRVTMFMALAVPVICSPLPSYLEVIKHRENGYIAHSDEEWVNSLVELSNIENRKKIGNAAYTFVHDEYSIEKTSKKLLSILHEVVNRK